MNFLFRLRGLLCSFGGLCLCVAPFLAWMKLDFLGLKMGIPGFFWHGAWLFGLGASVVILSLSGWRRLSPALLVLAGAGIFLVYHDGQQIWIRGDYFLAQWQLRLAPLNQMLANLNMATLEIYHRTPPQERIGEGLYWAIGGLVAVVSGWVLGLWVEVQRGASPLSVALGSPRCRDCHFPVGASMRFCPGCGRSRTGLPACRRCGESVKKGYCYCPGCGESVSSS